MRIYYYCLIVFLGVAECLSAQLGLPDQRETLNHVGHLSVDAYITGDDDLLGLVTENRLKTKIELKLRTHDIWVVDSLVSPTLIFQLRVVHPTFESGRQTAGYVYYATLAMRELVWNDKTKVMEAYTWVQSMIGVSNRNDIDGVVDRMVEELTDIFINDYLAANPKADKR